MKHTVAIVRGTFLNTYEMQFFEPLVKDFSITAFGSLTPYHDKFLFPVVKLPSPMDLPDFPYKMPILNRLFVDAHYLVGLEKRLQGFDLVHTAETYYHYTQQALSAKRRGYVKKVIATVLENIPFNNEGIWGRKAFKKRAREELDHIIALTQKTKESLLIEGCDPSKITVIGHFIDTQTFRPRHDYLRILGDRRQRNFTIMFAGRLEEYKGVLDVLTAAKILLADQKQHDVSLTFLFVGGGAENTRLENFAKQWGIDRSVRITNAPYEKMPSLYQHADIFVAPSKATRTWQEQYNTALLEAQASGLPIVTTRTGGIPENVGGAAILIEPGDARGLAVAIQQFLDDPKLRLRYARLARRRAETVHDIDLGAKKLARLYKRILSDG